MSTYKDIPEDNIDVSVSELNQIVDVLGNYIKDGNNTIQTFTQLGLSGTFQTVYDQDFTSITANKIFDLTYGQAETSRLTGSAGAGTRDLEVKTQIYRQFAQTLLGSADSVFTVPFLSSSATSEMKECLFIGVKRLFHRDKILEDTITLNMFGTSGSYAAGGGWPDGNLAYHPITDRNFGYPNITPIQTEVTTLYSGSANLATPVGLAFLEQGVIVLDISRSFDGDQTVIQPQTDGAGTTTLNTDNWWYGNPIDNNGLVRSVLSGSTIDDICNAVRETRFLTGTNGSAFNVGMEFQNVTRIHSAIIAAEIGFEDFNLSSNPTFVDADGNIRTLTSVNGINNPTTFITSLGLHDAAGNLLAVGKPSRPIRNSRETRYAMSLRLDF